MDMKSILQLAEEKYSKHEMCGDVAKFSGINQMSLEDTAKWFFVDGFEQGFTCSPSNTQYVLDHYEKKIKELEGFMSMDQMILKKDLDCSNDKIESLEAKLADATEVANLFSMKNKELENELGKIIKGMYEN